ncbi:hypothetical protein pb186bvf_014077 [Paramecium bursaria]
MSKDENLNQFSKYSSYASYHQRYSVEQPKQYIQSKNPLDFYQRHNLELPRSLKDDHIKMFSEPQSSQLTTQQQKESGQIGPIYHYSSQIDRLCQHADHLIGGPIKPQSPKIIEPFSPKIEESDKQKKAFPDLEKEFQLFLEFKQSKSQLPQVEKSNVLDTSIEQPQKTLQRKSVRELYQRNQNKKVFCVEEIQDSGRQKKQSTITHLGAHPNQEVQKAMQVLMGQKN